MSPDQFQEIFNVSRETMEDLRAYENLLSKWNRAINLVSPNTLPQVWARHFADSAQLLKHAPRNPATWTDLGSGGGLPALVIAILLKHQKSPCKMTMIESDSRKCSFLRTVARELKLQIDVITSRIEAVETAPAEVISARALAPIDQLLHLSQPHRQKTGICLFLKGQSHEDELTQAAKNWHMEVETIASITNPSSAIIKIGEFSVA